MKCAGLISVVEEAWKAYECADSRVRPSVPILFFGDLDAYFASPFRVVTVGLNPSRKEFPEDSRFKRFPECGEITAADGERYLDGLCSYFREDPYNWFGFYDTVLGGAEASYYPGKPSTALHTDIASPVATDPTWKDLGESECSALQEKGGLIWHQLLKVLKPQMVLLSVARKHMERIEFPALNGWRTIHEFKRTKDGERRRRPYPVCARWYEIMGDPSLFIFGQAAQKPFALLSSEQKRRVGEIARETYDKGHEDWSCTSVASMGS